LRIRVSMSAIGSVMFKASASSLLPRSGRVASFGNPPAADDYQLDFFTPGS
jgi:hypothetical protein